MGHRLALASFGLLTLVPLRALAHNLDHQRTPVDWSGAPCVTVIDRSVDPVYPLEYGIPFEDTELSEDEPPDSRRHQFFGFCRDHFHEHVLPNWISMADVDVGVALELGTYDDVDPSVDVLDAADTWQGCFVRINPDDARKPITFEAASEPVLWDTSDLAAGTWVVEAYTWEPWFNLWTEHPGVFKIVDGPDLLAHAPAAALDYDEQVVEPGETVEAGGCVSAIPGSTMTLSWALGGEEGGPNWHGVAEGVAVEGESFELEFPAPQEAAHLYMLLRLEVEDPEGRTWTSYGTRYISVIPLGSGDEDAGGEDADADGGETSDGTQTGETSEGPGAEDDAGSGCVCGTTRPVRRPLPLVCALGLLAVGYASRSRSCFRAR